MKRLYVVSVTLALMENRIDTYSAHTFATSEAEAVGLMVAAMQRNHPGRAIASSSVWAIEDEMVREAYAALLPTAPPVTVGVCDGDWSR